MKYLYIAIPIIIIVLVLIFGSGKPTDIPTDPVATSTPATTTSKQAVWTSDVPTTGKLEYGTSTDYTETLYSTTSSTTHTVRLKYLQIGQTYFFRATVTSQDDVSDVMKYQFNIE